MWMYFGSKNNLKDVHKLYNPHAKSISKDARDIFVKGSLKDVTNNFQARYN